MSESSRNRLKKITRTLTIVAANLAFVFFYFVAGKFGLSLAFVHASASAVWPPSGIALAALLVWGYRFWPGIFLGAFLVNITTQGSVATTLGIAAGNTLEALLGAWLVCRFANGVKAFERATNVFKFVLLAAVLSTAVSATFGITSLTLGGFAEWEQYPVIWLTWWLGDMAGVLIVAPVLVIWLTQPLLPLRYERLFEAVALLITVVLVGPILFLAKIPSGLEHLAILPLLWAAFRFGERGAVTSALAMSGVALWSTLQGFGPFAMPTSNQSLLLLQAFMATITATALVLAGVVSERKRAEQRLQVQDAVSRILAESPALKEAAPKIVQILCERAGWEVGAIWGVDQNSRELACVEFWHVPSTQVPEFEAITRGGPVLSRNWPAWASLEQRRTGVDSRRYQGQQFPARAGGHKSEIARCLWFPDQIGQRDSWRH